MPDYLVLVANSRMYHSELSRISVNILFGLSTDMLSLYFL